MIAEPVMELTPLSSLLRVKVTRPAERTESGIWLPEVSQNRPAEGEVISVGPGRVLEWGLRSIVWPKPHDLVLYNPHAPQDWCGDGYDVMVRAEEVLGVVDPDTDEVTPENDWVSVAQDAAEEETRGGVVIAERHRKAPQRGTVLDLGPGLLLLSGRMAGTRKAIRAIMGLKDDEPLIGRTVWWEGRSKTYQVGGKCPCTLVRACDIFAIED